MFLRTELSLINLVRSSDIFKYFFRYSKIDKIALNIIISLSNNSISLKFRYSKD